MKDNTFRGVKEGRQAVTRRETALAEWKKEENWQSGIERTRGGVDRVMFFIILVLLAAGAVMMYSASYPTAIASKSGDGLAYLKKHLMFMAIGGVGMTAATFVPIKWYKKWIPFFSYGISVLLLLAVLVIGTSEGEAKRWIYIGNFSFQPSELMKVSLVFILAWYIEKNKTYVEARPLNTFGKKLKGVIAPLLLVGFACVLVLLEKHLSGTIIIGILGLLVILVGGCHPIWSPAITAGGGLIGGGLFLIMNPYALERLKTYFSAEANVLDEKWQTTQGLLAIGSGGLLGVGFCDSRLKYSYVSMAHNDFIFTIWCEELGFVGAVALIGLFVAFIWRGYVIASRAPDTFTALSVFGITTQVGLQALLNMMVVCDIIPNTGISLPFFSYGGSSLIMLMVEMGFVLSVSRQSYRRIPRQ